MLIITLLLFSCFLLFFIYKSRFLKPKEIINQNDSFDKYLNYNSVILEYQSSNKSLTMNKIKRAKDINERVLEILKIGTSNYIDEIDRLSNELVELFKNDIPYFKEIDLKKKSEERNKKINSILN